MATAETVIFLMEEPFTNRDYARFGVHYLLGDGFRVEAWDLSPVLHPGVALHGDEPGSLPGGFTPRRFSTRSEFLQAVRCLHPATLVNCLIGYSGKTLFVFRALSRRGIPYAVTVTNALPRPERTTRAIGPDLPVKVLSLLLDTFLLRGYRLLGVEPASLCLTGGEQTLGQIRHPVDIEGGRTAILPLHTLDYDLCLDLGGPQPPAPENFAVFLDGDDFYHQDLRFMKVAVPGWIDTYFAELRSLFDVLEKDLGTRIVIAAHPRSQYTPEQEARFGGREVIRGKTPELVKRCRFAILHASTAMNFAVLFGKPLLFLTDRNYEKYVMGPYIEVMAKEVGKTPVYLDRPLPGDWEEELRVDSQAYGNYRRKYIKADGSGEGHSWEILARFLKGTRQGR